MEMKLTGPKAIVAVLAVIGFLGFKFNIQTEALQTEGVEEIKKWLQLESVRAVLPDMKQAVEAPRQNAEYLEQMVNDLQEENIEIDPSQVQTETQTTIDYYKQTLSKKDARKLSSDNVYSNVMTNIMADMLMRQSMERLRAIFQGMDDEEDFVTEDLFEQDGQETDTASVPEDIETAGDKASLSDVDTEKSSDLTDETEPTETSDDSELENVIDETPTVLEIDTATPAETEQDPNRNLQEKEYYEYN